MRLVFDPIYTGDIQRCASAVKFKRLATVILENPEVEILWLVPEGITDEGRAWIPQTDRITCVPYSNHRDRYIEYRRLPTVLVDLLDIRGACWTWDVWITNRTSLIPQMASLANGHSRSAANFKTFLCIEDFPLMTFKGYASIPNSPLQDAFTLLGYLNSAETYICAYWEKALIADTARAMFSPSVVKQLRDTVQECHPYELSSLFHTKSKSVVLDQPNQPFTLVFAGRMVNGHQFDKIFNVMGNNWILKSHEREIRPVVCTQSRGDGRVIVPDFVQVKYLGRDDFWAFMKTEASVGVFFSPEEDYSMSLIEPLLLGVPYAVYKAPWATASLGEDYPFFFRSENEAYAIVKSFYDDYVNQYLRFAQWQRGKFMQLIAERDKNTVATLVMKKIISRAAELCKVKIPQSKEGKTTVEKLYDLLDETPKTFGELVQELGKHEEVRHLAQKVNLKDQKAIGMSFITDFYWWKLQFLTLGAKEHGWGKFYKPKTQGEDKPPSNH